MDKAYRLNVDQIDTLRELVQERINGIETGEVTGLPGDRTEELVHLADILFVIEGDGVRTISERDERRAAALDSDF